MAEELVAAGADIGGGVIAAVVGLLGAGLAWALSGSGPVAPPPPPPPPPPPSGTGVTGALSIWSATAGGQTSVVSAIIGVPVSAALSWVQGDTDEAELWAAVSTGAAMPPTGNASGWTKITNDWRYTAAPPAGTQGLAAPPIQIATAGNTPGVYLHLSVALKKNGVWVNDGWHDPHLSGHIRLVSACIANLTVWAGNPDGSQSMAYVHAGDPVDAVLTWVSGDTDEAELWVAVSNQAEHIPPTGADSGWTQIKSGWPYDAPPPAGTQGLATNPVQASTIGVGIGAYLWFSAVLKKDGIWRNEGWSDSGRLSAVMRVIP